jgi:uncharacterized membrane protein YhaH (DUF805 family)
MLDFGEAVRRFYGNYVNADGRAQRSAYWWVMLYQLIIYCVLFIVLFMAEGSEQILEVVNEVLDGNEDAEFGDDFRLGASGIVSVFLMVIFGLVNFLPNIMLQIRRFHDLGQTGWLVLVFRGLGALPGIGILFDIANLIWFLFPGTQGANKYGPDPLSQNTDIFG